MPAKRLLSQFDESADSFALAGPGRHLTVSRSTGASSSISSPSWSEVRAIARRRLARHWRKYQLPAEGSKVVSVQLSGLEVYTRYSVWVRAMGTQGETSGLGGVLSFTTLEESPGGPPLNVRASAVSNTAVEVSWEQPNRSNGRIEVSNKCYLTGILVKRLILLVRKETLCPGITDV
ncbi:unnamed protein product [Protopolystoma xenopodis]|uniref:Fibronectin type-III domain-containing protein n=1 Tax=Protopolystoma xenopodis TaxID=117903 RepID=A0A448XFT8_9PLAT|nr:unnamed protein product [Protopolystoma xenopodis]